MVVLKQGLESFWKPYQKDTGRGIKTVVRKAHSAQSSEKLKEWQYAVAIAAHRGDVMKKARDNCIKAAQEAIKKSEGNELRAAMRFFREYNKDKIEDSVCKMSALRPYLREVLQAVHKDKNTYLKQEAQAEAQGQTKTSELRVFKF